MTAEVPRFWHKQISISLLLLSRPENVPEAITSKVFMLEKSIWKLHTIRIHSSQLYSSRKFYLSFLLYTTLRWACGHKFTVKLTKRKNINRFICQCWLERIFPFYVRRICFSFLWSPLNLNMKQFIISNKIIQFKRKILKYFFLYMLIIKYSTNQFKTPSWLQSLILYIIYYYLGKSHPDLFSGWMTKRKLRGTEVLKLWC